MIHLSISMDIDNSNGTNDSGGNTNGKNTYMIIITRRTSECATCLTRRVARWNQTSHATRMNAVTHAAMHCCSTKGGAKTQFTQGIPILRIADILRKICDVLRRILRMHSLSHAHCLSRTDKYTHIARRTHTQTHTQTHTHACMDEARHTRNATRMNVCVCVCVCVCV